MLIGLLVRLALFTMSYMDENIVWSTEVVEATVDYLV
jgi:hypothetical protein